MIVAAGCIAEERRSRRRKGMRLMRLTLPLRKRVNGRTIVWRDPIHYVIVAIRVADVCGISVLDSATRGIGVQQYIVPHRNQPRGLSDQKRPASGRGHVHRVVKYLQVPR